MSIWTLCRKATALTQSPSVKMSVVHRFWLFQQSIVYLITFSVSSKLAERFIGALNSTSKQNLWKLQNFTSLFFPPSTPFCSVFSISWGHWQMNWYPWANNIHSGGTPNWERPWWVFPSSSDLWFLAALGRKGATPARGRVSAFSAPARFWVLLPRMQILLVLQKETLFRGLYFQFQFNSC